MVAYEIREISLWFDKKRYCKVFKLKSTAFFQKTVRFLIFNCYIISFHPF